MRRRQPGSLAATLALLATLGPWLPSSAADRPGQPAATISATAPVVTRSAPAEPLDVTLTVQRVVKDAQGKEEFVDAADARPGDLLEYRAVYANRGTRTLNELQATLPLPAETEYQPRTASPTGVLASAGAEYAPEPLQRKVRGADGKEAVVPVPYAQYRALRWRIATIEPGRSVTVRARVRVASGPNLAAAPAALAAPATR